MNKKQLKETIETLEEEININKKTCEKLKYRRQIILANKFESNLVSILAYSIISYLILNFTFLSLATNIDFSFLSAFAPNITIPIVFTTIPLLIGTKINKKINKKEELEKKLYEFSNAKTEEEKLEEEIKYNMEIEKKKNKNAILDGMLRNLKKDYDMLEALSNKYEIIEKDKKITYDGIENYGDKILNQGNNLLHAYKQLDTLSNKKVLNEKFEKFREKNYMNADLVNMVLFPSFLFLILTSLPFLAIKDMLTFYSVLQSMIFSLAFSLTISSGYLMVKQKMEKKVFRKLNNKLGDEKLSETFDKQYKVPIREQEVLNNEITIKIEEMVSMHVDYNEQIVKYNNDLSNYMNSKMQNAKPNSFMMSDIDETILSNGEKGKQLVLKK